MVGATVIAVAVGLAAAAPAIILPRLAPCSLATRNVRKMSASSRTSVRAVGDLRLIGLNLLNNAVPLSSSSALKATIHIGGIDPSDCDAVFLPGGHGTMLDLPDSTELAGLLGKAWAPGKVIAAVRHGPAGLVNARDETGAPLVKGRCVTGFADSEVRAVGLDAAVPVLLESRLRELGGWYESVAGFQPFAVTDGRLVTGQNPAILGTDSKAYAGGAGRFGALNETNTISKKDVSHDHAASAEHSARHLCLRALGLCPGLH